MKLSCKLFVLNVLETDKVDWVERGYGILKVIDSNDGVNCKMSKIANFQNILFINQS